MNYFSIAQHLAEANTKAQQQEHLLLLGNNDCITSKIQCMSSTL